jgi:TorA maturation chaperone TorD
MHNINSLPIDPDRDRDSLLNAVSRQKVYSFLAEIFLQEPTATRWSEQCQVLAELLKEMGEAPEFGNYVPEDLPAAVEKAQQEFYDSFFVPMSGHYVPPFESALQNYKSGVKRPFGPLNSSEGNHVAQCYAGAGFYPWALNIFDPLREIRLSDHIGFELAFMAMLCTSEILAWESKQTEEALKWQQVQKGFLKEHLAQWVSQFAQAMHEIAPGYYAEAAKVTEHWVKNDSNELSQGLIA